MLAAAAHEVGAKRPGAGGECVGTRTCGRWAPWPRQVRGARGGEELRFPDFREPQGSREGSFPLLSSLFVPPGPPI